MAWSQAASTCRAVVSVVREPRSVLPSTAIARAVCRGAVVARPASQSPIAAVSSCGSRACNSRRIIASDGRRSGVDAQGESGRGRDVGDPFGDRRVGAVAGHDGADRRGDHDRQPVPDTSPSAWIRQIGERCGQPTSGFGHGQSRCAGQGGDQR